MSVRCVLSSGRACSVRIRSTVLPLCQGEADVVRFQVRVEPSLWFWAFEPFEDSRHPRQVGNVIHSSSKTTYILKELGICHLLHISYTWEKSVNQPMSVYSGSQCSPESTDIKFPVHPQCLRWWYAEMVDGQCGLPSLMQEIGDGYSSQIIRTHCIPHIFMVLLRISYHKQSTGPNSSTSEVIKHGSWDIHPQIIIGAGLCGSG